MSAWIGSKPAKPVVADIDALGLLEKIEDRKVQVPTGDRSGVVIEPMLTDQWYVNAKELAKDAITAMNAGHASSTPAHPDESREPGQNIKGAAEPLTSRAGSRVEHGMSGERGRDPLRPRVIGKKPGTNG